MSYKKMYEAEREFSNNMVRMYNQVRQQHNPYHTINFNKVGYTNMLVAKDRVLCANRYLWKIPTSNVTSQQIEALFYDYGALALFEDEFGIAQLTKFVMIGQLNDIGQLCEIQPIGFDGKTYPVMKAVISGRGEPPIVEGEKVAVIIYDYTTLTQAPDEMCRRIVNYDSTICSQVDVYAQLHNNIRLSIKKALAVCETEEQAEVVKKQVENIFDTSSPINVVAKQKGKGNKITAELPFELFNFDNNFDTQNYCQTIDFYDKQRRSFNGIPAPDTFEKKERKITAESENTNVHTDIMLYDGLMQRQNGVELFKKYCQNPENKNISVEYGEILKMSFEENDNDNESEENNDDRDIK